MPLSADDTSRDLPVKDVGLTGGPMSAMMQEQDVRLWRGPSQVLKIQDRQRVFKVPREQLEDQFLRLLEENKLLKQHTRIQEQKLRRLSTKLLRLKNVCPGSSGGRDVEIENTIEALEARVVTLESQKETLRSKLSSARKQIQALDGKTYRREHTGRVVHREEEIRQVSQTTLPRYALSFIEDNRGDTEKLFAIEAQQMRGKELELASQSLKEASKKEIEETIRMLLRQQVDMHRLTIKDNVDVIRLQKQLCDNRTALLVSQEKFTMLQEVYESQLSEGQKSLRESQAALLEQVGQLTEQIKEEKKKVLSLEGQLNTANLTLQGLAELQERISDLEGERNLLKKSYDALLTSTLSNQNQNHNHQGEQTGKEKERDNQIDQEWQAKVCVLEEKIENEMRRREKLEQENVRIRYEYETSQDERAKELALTAAIKEKNDRLEQEVSQCIQEVTSLQEKLNKVTQGFDMSVEELSDTLLQIKTFRLQQQSCKDLQRLMGGEKVEDSSQELSALQASHAETVLELQKTRDLLIMQHRISSDLQAELKIEIEKAERERELNRTQITKKDKLLNSRALQINNLQAQLKDLSYNPRKPFIPEQYTANVINQELFYQMDENTPSQVRDGESLLEIHLSGVTFTPVGLRLMRQERDGPDELVTFCTYTLFDFQVHSTPLVSGTQPNYGFKSCFALSCFNLARLGGPGGFAHVELHQALGGVKFVTRGRGRITLMGTLQHRGEKVKGRASITGSKGEIIGVLEFWVCLYPQGGPKSVHIEQIKDRNIYRWPVHQADWSSKQPDTQHLYDYGGGIPNELVVVLECCSGLTARWPGLLPDAYLAYRLYDLPPHSTPIVPCCADPVFADSTTYPLAVTADLIEYLKVSSLWVYMFDDNEKQAPPVYLAKTSVPLQALTTGRQIKGDFVLRDPAGVPRGMVRVNLYWRYPFQSTGAPFRPTRMEEAERDKERIGECEVNTVKEVSQRPVAKPRSKVMSKLSLHKDEKELSSSPPKTHRHEVSQQHKSPVSKSRVQIPDTPNISSGSDLASIRRQNLKAKGSSESLESFESTASSDSDVVIIPHSAKPINKVDRIRVEILSLLFHPSSSVTLARSVQQVYVEYRLLGIPMKTTETPMCLRKPTEGEEIHYNFSRVIHINTMDAAPLRQYLYTVLEGTDPNQGRLKFTVVSEPLNEENECEDVGQAYLDLRELLLTGNDVTERQINITRMDDDQEVVGRLKVSIEAAQALRRIYLEYHNQTEEEGVQTEAEDTETDEEAK